MGDPSQKYVNDNEMNLKNSFWKKNIRNLPGRASPKKENKPLSSAASTSFDDFQESIDDAWEINTEDEIFRISDLKISKRMSHSAAVSVINNHKASIEEIHKSKNFSDEKGKSNMKNKESQNKVNFSSVEVDSNKLTKFHVLIESDLLDLDDLKKLSWSGVPAEVRPMTWRLLAGYLPTSSERRQQVLNRKRIDYANLVIQYYDTNKDDVYKDTYRQIHIDIPRMSTPLFQQITVQEIFERILFIWAIRHPASGYVQGMNDLVTPFFVVFLQEYLPIGTNIETLDVSSISKENLDFLEADSFWCLSKFLDGIQDNYIFAQLGIQYKVNLLKELIQRIDGILHEHLMKHGIDYLQFSFRWINNLLTREFPLRCSIRLWDTYLAESDCFATFQLYVCAAFLMHWRQELLEKNDFQGLMIMLQNLPTQNWTDTDINLLLAEAYRLKFTFADAPNHLSTKRNMTVFWLHGEELMFGGNGVHPVQQRIPQMKMMKVHIPFTFKLHETSNSSYSDLRCTISSQVPYTLQAFWGVSIRELHHFLWKAWSSFQTAVKDESLLRGHYQNCGLTLHETSHTEKTVQMFMPEGKLDLGTPPRHCYPLVIFLIRDTPVNSTLHPDETVALVNVVHIRDNVCTLPTNILAQYLKQANGQLSSLKQLYLATGNALSYQDDTSSDDASSQKALVLDNGSGALSSSQEQLCVVCQYYPLSRALLPCRHTCICASCFGKLETCPMCRSPIKSYFCVRTEDYLADCALGLEKTSASAKRQAVSQWIQNGITDFLGLH